MKQEGPEAPNRSQILEKWVTSPSQPPAGLRPGAMGKGREGDKSLSQGLGRKGFMNLSIGHLHGLRHKASADLTLKAKSLFPPKSNLRYNNFPTCFPPKIIIHNTTNTTISTNNSQIIVVVVVKSLSLSLSLFGLNTTMIPVSGT